MLQILPFLVLLLNKNTSTPVFFCLPLKTTFSEFNSSLCPPFQFPQLTRYKKYLTMQLFSLHLSQPSGGYFYTSYSIACTCLLSQIAIYVRTKKKERAKEKWKELSWSSQTVISFSLMSDSHCPSDSNMKSISNLNDM
jgi:hypothetical protein